MRIHGTGRRGDPGGRQHGGGPPRTRCRLSAIGVIILSVPPALLATLVAVIGLNLSIFWALPVYSGAGIASSLLIAILCCAFRGDA
ncbi:hypothetical protein [Roseivivax sp. CAU 1761]